MSKPIILIDVDEAAKFISRALAATPWLGLFGATPPPAVKKKARKK